MKALQRVLIVVLSPFILLLATGAIVLFFMVSLGYRIATGKSFSERTVPDCIRRHLPF